MSFRMIRLQQEHEIIGFNCNSILSSGPFQLHLLQSAYYHVINYLVHGLLGSVADKFNKIQKLQTCAGEWSMVSKQKKWQPRKKQQITQENKFSLLRQAPTGTNKENKFSLL